MRTMYSKQHVKGFSLIEVVLAIGIFLVTVLALVGLLGPTLKSVDEVEKTDEVSSVVNTVNAFLQNSSDIAPNASKFNAIYNAVEDGGFATVYVFRQYIGSSTDIQLEVGFDAADISAGVRVDPLAQASGFADAAGPIYRVVLTPSSVIPDAHITDLGEGEYPRYELDVDLDSYPEGYFAMEVRIFALESDMVAATGSAIPTVAPGALVDVEPIFTYNTAIVR